VPFKVYVTPANFIRSSLQPNAVADAVAATSFPSVSDPAARRHLEDLMERYVPSCKWEFGSIVQGGPAPGDLRTFGDVPWGTVDGPAGIADLQELDRFGVELQGRLLVCGSRRQ